MATRKLISFDRAMKRLLRSKANFGILEAFLSVLLRDETEIIEVLESESNRELADARSNRRDLKVRNRGGELVLIEGRKEGRREGRDERSLEIARAMEAQGVATSVIAECTGLDATRIEGL